MVESQLKARDIVHPKVLEVMGRLKRHEFIPEELRKNSYADHPIHIGQEQTISQPYIVALMTQLLDPSASDRVLEIGTGSGYQTAVLKELGCDVYSIEYRPALFQKAVQALARLGYSTDHIKTGNGYLGWADAAPFDKIIVTAACRNVPEPLLAQLKDPGIMVFPCGEWEQNLVQLRKKNGKVNEREITKVRFVPLAGETERS